MRAIYPRGLIIAYIANNKITMSLNNLPDPPPGAHPVQLELWRRVLQRRYRQIEALSPSTFNSFVNGVASDYENSLLNSSQMDLTKSHYSSFLLPRRHDADAAVVDYNNNNSTAKQIAFHLLALFYTAIDERMPPPERQFAIDTVKRAFSLLDETLKDKDKNDGDSDGSEYVVGKHGRDEEEEDKDEEEHEAEMPKKKHARKDNIGQNDNGDVQNIPSDRSNEEGEHEGEKSNVSRIGDEGGETAVASSGPSVATSKQNESEEGVANEMHIDASNGLGTATQDGTEEATVDDGGGEEGVKSGMSLNVSTQNQVDGDVVDNDAMKQPAEPLPSKEGDTSIEEAVAADDDVAKPAQSDTSKDETQPKEPIEASGGVPISEHQAVQQIVQPGTHGEVDNTDEVMDNEVVRIH